MGTNKIIGRILLVMLFIFLCGAGFSFYKNYFSSEWTEKDIQNVKDGCLLLSQPQEFCECYTNQIIARVSPREFNELAENRNNSEADFNKAKTFIDSVVENCAEYRK